MSAKQTPTVSKNNPQVRGLPPSPSSCGCGRVALAPGGALAPAAKAYLSVSKASGEGYAITDSGGTSSVGGLDTLTDLDGHARS